jgi:hypothetical protein
MLRYIRKTPDALLAPVKVAIEFLLQAESLRPLHISDEGSRIHQRISLMDRCLFHNNTTAYTKQKRLSNKNHFPGIDSGSETK